MSKKNQKTLKMGQKIKKMSPIIKKSCYLFHLICSHTPRNAFNLFFKLSGRQVVQKMKKVSKNSDFGPKTAQK